MQLLYVAPSQLMMPTPQSSLELEAGHTQPPVLVLLLLILVVVREDVGPIQMLAGLLSPRSRSLSAPLSDIKTTYSPYAMAHPL